MIKKKEIIPPKGLTADLINKYSIFNGTKYFSTSGLQNYLVFDLIKRNKVHIKFSTVVKNFVGIYRTVVRKNYKYKSP